MRKLPFVVELRNTTSQVATDITVGIFLPAQRAVGQRCCAEITSSVPMHLVTDALGNQAAVMQFDRIAPYAVTIARVTVTLAGPDDALAQTPLSYADRQDLLNATPLIQAADPEILRLAQTLRTDSDRATAQGIHDWVSGHITYSGYRRDAAGARDALRRGRGDCTEYMHLFAAIARAAGLPVRPIAGYVLDAGELPRANTLHNWAEVLIDGRWLIADPQRGQFDPMDRRYLALRVLMADDQAPWPPAAVRFWSSGEGVSVRMD